MADPRIQYPEGWDEDASQRREWTRADRLRFAAFALAGLQVLGLLLLGPVGDGVVQRAAEASGTGAGQAQLVYWVSAVGSVIVGAALGAGAAGARQPWAIWPPIVGIVVSWIGFGAALALV